MGVAAVLPYVPRTMRNTAKVKMAVLKACGTAESVKWHKDNQVTITGKDGERLTVAEVKIANEFGDIEVEIKPF